MAGYCSSEKVFGKDNGVHFQRLVKTVFLHCFAFSFVLTGTVPMPHDCSGRCCTKAVFAGYSEQSPRNAHCCCNTQSDPCCGVSTDRYSYSKDILGVTSATKVLPSVNLFPTTAGDSVPEIFHRAVSVCWNLSKPKGSPPLYLSHASLLC